MGKVSPLADYFPRLFFPNSPKNHPISSLTDIAFSILLEFRQPVGYFMVRFPVSEEKNRWLAERMKALGVREEDIEEKFVRSSGSGGQKVNKTSTCVCLRHIPTGIEVKCMRERSQSLNRFLARRELVEKIAKTLGPISLVDTKMEKMKRRKVKRRKRSRLKYRSGLK